MKKFMVKLHGEDFLFDLDGEPKRFGFHATRFVMAESPKEAGKIAIVLIHQSPEFAKALSDESAGHPRIDVEEVREVGLLKFLIKKSTRGFDFYSAEEL